MAGALAHGCGRISQAVLQEKERQAAEARQRRCSFSKRTGGGFVVNFSPRVGFATEAQATPTATAREEIALRKDGAAGASASGSASSRVVVEEVEEQQLSK